MTEILRDKVHCKTHGHYTCTVLNTRPMANSQVPPSFEAEAGNKAIKDKWES